MKRHQVKLIIPAAAVLLLATLGCGSPSALEEAGAGEHAPAVEREDAQVDDEVLRLDAAAISRLGLSLAVAGPGEIESAVELPGEVQVNGDRMAHVSPRVGGVVRDVRVSLGDVVREGQIMAVLESRELADAKAAFLAAAERMTLAEATFEREERLWNGRVSSEQDYLDARKNRAEARIELRTVEQKLHALGVPQNALEQLVGEPDATFTEYVLTAPFSGTVIDRHITIGESVPAGTAVFTVADLSSVWIDLAVYQRDIGVVRSGQTARVDTPHGDVVELTIDFVQPLVGEDTRTATARILAPNTDGVWHPGCFVTAMVTTSKEPARVLVPSTAVIGIEGGEEVVFVATEEGFEARHVTVRRRARSQVEIAEGVEPGERYVAEGAFSLKAELVKDSFGDGHGH